MSRSILVQIPKDQAPLFFEPDVCEALQELGEVTWNPYERSLTPDEVVELIPTANVCITSWGSVPIRGEVLNAAKELQLIAHAAGSVKPYVSLEVFNRNITVLHSGEAIAVSVAESVLALMLASLHKIPEVDNRMKHGEEWKTGDMEANELRGKTVGLVGLGLVARKVIKLLEPFGVRIAAYDPLVTKTEAEALGVEQMSFREVIQSSHVLSLHAPQIPETYHMLDQEELNLIPDGSLLVNTARGSLLNEQALIQALRKNRFRAALDVFEDEPLPLGSELRRMENVILRPHLAGVNPDSRLRIGRTVTEDIIRFFAGETVLHSVSREQLSVMT